MIITTGDHGAEGATLRATRLADKTGSRFVPRNRTSLTKLSEKYGDKDILVVLEGGARLIREGKEPLTFHPSMAFVRAKRLLKGEPDTMLAAARLSPGDSVLDCTAGLGSDSMIFALGAGTGGRVTAIEGSLPLWALLHEGLSNYQSGLLEFDEALRRIDTLHADHLEVLKSLPDRSLDIVYFDPMFRDPIQESSSISPLRTFANSSSISPQAIAEACRVARKTVVLKEKKGSGEFTRLGFQEVLRSHTKIVYGVIPVDQQ